MEGDNDDCHRTMETKLNWSDDVCSLIDVAVQIQFRHLALHINFQITESRLVSMTTQCTPIYRYTCASHFVLLACTLYNRVSLA